MQEILVCNCGSSSVKIDLFEIRNSEIVFRAAASADRIGTEDCTIKLDSLTTGADPRSIAATNAGHEEVIIKIAEEFDGYGLFLPENRMAVGHRIVHGAHFIKDPVLLDDSTLDTIRKCFEFAPLHNPVNLKGIVQCQQLFKILQVGVFDTAFHQTIPQMAHSYALPDDLVQKYSIKKYGFHGTSHEYVSTVAAKLCQKQTSEFNCISLHLGNGASTCAIQKGQSIDTSMGFTPVEGLVMGTRCGDMDPALPGLLAQKENLNWSQLDHLLNKQSGLKGICGKSDMRDILEAADQNDPWAAKARDIFAYRLRKYIGSYLTVMDRIDAIIFTGGIGENSAQIRKLSLDRLDHLNIRLDPVKNESPFDHQNNISQDSASIPILVIKTDEEWMIAKKTRDLIHPQ